jgi:hypothetical protein
MPTLDELIAQHLQEALASGELRGTPGWGRALDFGDGYDDTPAELRMPFKILKDAGFVPAEIEWMHRAAAVKAELASASEPGRVDALRRELADLQQRIALRLEKLRASGSL